MITRSNALVVALLATALMVGGATPGDAVTVVTKRFGSVGVFFGGRDTTTGQFVRVNVANYEDPDYRPNPCVAQVTLFDAAGTVRREERFNVANGQIGSRDLTAQRSRRPPLAVAGSARSLAS